MFVNDSTEVKYETLGSLTMLTWMDGTLDIIPEIMMDHVMFSFNPPSILVL